MNRSKDVDANEEDVHEVAKKISKRPRSSKRKRPLRTSVMSFMKSVWSSMIAQPSWRIVVGEDVSLTLKSRISLRR